MKGPGPCISAVAYAFPAKSCSVKDLAVLGQLESPPALLEEFGFGHVHVATTESPYDLALKSAGALIAERALAPEDIDMLLYCGTPSAAFSPGGKCADASDHLASFRRFRYPATRLQYDLGLERASVIALDQLACTTLFEAIRLAKALCLAGDAKRILCVSSEFFPGNAGREAIFNCTSDAGCALLVEEHGAHNRIVASTQVTKGYYWDCEARRSEIVASYFPTAVQVITETLRCAGWSPQDVSWVLPHNVSVRSWDILMGLLGIPRERLWSRNIARDGHTLSGDNFINLRDAIDRGDVQPKDRLLLFSFGYGAHWTALALEA